MKEPETPLAPIPAAVFLDTSVFASQQYNFASTAFAAFLPLCKKHGMKVLMPDPTAQEVRRHLTQRVNEALIALESVRKKAPFLAKWAHFPKVMPRERTPVFEAQNEWKAFLVSLGAVSLDYAGVDVKEVMQWYDRSLAPFNEGPKRKEFPDAFSISILNEYARKHSCYIAVVSHDPDFKRACERFPSLSYFATLPSLSESLLSSAASFPRIHAAVANGRDLLIKRLNEELEQVSYSHVKRNFYDVSDTQSRGGELGEVRIVSLGERECTVAFDGTAEVEYRLEWAEQKYEDDEPHSFAESLVESFPFSGTAKLEVDTESDTISSIAFVELEEYEFLLEESPRRYW